MNKLISWGAGVNSTAIIALHLLGKLEGRPEIVFADTGCEHPETYYYIKVVKNILTQKGWKTMILKPDMHPEYYWKHIHKRNLYQWLWDNKTIPCDYGDPWTKKTCLWGDFNIPKKSPVEPTEGSKIHRYPPSKERSDLRSIVSPKFAQAFFKANR